MDEVREDSRARLMSALRAAPDGLDVAELSHRLGLHANTVRWHLGGLERAGSVAARPSPRGSRGRPRMIYRLEGGAVEGTRDEYRLLANILTGTIAESAAGAGAAEQAGRSWGRYLVERPPPGRAGDEDAVARVGTLLAEQGFAPETATDEIRMHRCPFHDLAEAHPDVVCAVHRGLIDGALEELGSSLVVDELDVFVRPDLCVARLSAATSGSSGPSSRAARGAPA